MLQWIQSLKKKVRQHYLASTNKPDREAISNINIRVTPDPKNVKTEISGKDWSNLYSIYFELTPAGPAKVRLSFVHQGEVHSFSMIVLFPFWLLGSFVMSPSERERARSIGLID